MTLRDMGLALFVFGLGFVMGQGSRENGVTTAHVVSGATRVASEVYSQFQAPPAKAAPTRALFVPALNPEREEMFVNERRPRRG